MDTLTRHVGVSFTSVTVDYVKEHQTMDKQWALTPDNGQTVSNWSHLCLFPTLSSFLLDSYFSFWTSFLKSTQSISYTVFTHSHDTVVVVEVGMVIGVPKMAVTLRSLARRYVWFRVRYKGYVGIIKDATESTARVELHTSCKTISVDRQRLSIIIIVSVYLCMCVCARVCMSYITHARTHTDPITTTRGASVPPFIFYVCS